MRVITTVVPSLLQELVVSWSYGLVSSVHGYVEVFSNKQQLLAHKIIIFTSREFLDKANSVTCNHSDDRRLSCGIYDQRWVHGAPAVKKSSGFIGSHLGLQHEGESVSEGCVAKNMV